MADHVLIARGNSDSVIRTGAYSLTPGARPDSALTRHPGPCPGEVTREVHVARVAIGFNIMFVMGYLASYVLMAQAHTSIARHAVMGQVELDVEGWGSREIGRASCRERV